MLGSMHVVYGIYVLCECHIIVYHVCHVDRRCIVSSVLCMVCVMCVCTHTHLKI